MGAPDDSGWQAGCCNGFAGQHGKTPEGPCKDVMNLIQVVKTIFFMAVLLLLVAMGVNNRRTVDFSLPPVLQQEVRQPAALMYFAFFAVGVVTGTVAALGGRKPSGGKSAKSA